MKLTSLTPRFSLFDRFFSYLHNRSLADRVVFGGAVLVCTVTALLLLWQYNHAALVAVPTDGGTLKEGVIGTPRFINPVLAITRADQDMTALLYRGLFRVAADGSLEPDLAESLTISEDGTTYHIVLHKNNRFHDNTPVTADDVAYTISLIQDPELKSPLRGNWNDVTVEILNEFELNIILEEAYTPFVENLTVGILPKHVWSNLSADEFAFSQYNTEPVGSSVYQVAEINRSKAGLIESYELMPFAASTQATPYITRIEVHFFADEAELQAALTEGTVTHTSGLSVHNLNTLDAATYQIYEQTVPRVFAAFMNQNRSVVLRDRAARQALLQATDQAALVDAVLAGYGEPTYGPIPSGFRDKMPTSTALQSSSTIRTTLLAGGWSQADDGGWEKRIDDQLVPLSVTITTANIPLFENTARNLEAMWTAAGVDVSIALFEQSDLVQAVIRPRDYELLLFGVDVGRALDLYPFWHSSQREDPGLNIALYTNLKTDDYLESYRTSTDQEEQATLLTDLTGELLADVPAIFLFTPAMTYVTPREGAVTLPKRLSNPSDRFSTISNWYLHEETIWPFFIN